MKQTTLTTIVDRVTAREPFARIVTLATGAEWLATADSLVEGPLVGPVERALNGGGSMTADGPDGPVFIDVFDPPPRLVVIGAVHIAQVLAPIALATGYQVVVVDPRTAFAAKDRLPGVTLDTRWPDEALADIGIDRRTAVCALSHDPKIDDPALGVALTSSAFYIGALGSRRSHAARIERLKAAGQPDQALARIHAPIGLDIGAIGAAEIAVSIMAEVTQELRRRFSP